jgi:hypothetical protein
MRGLTTIHRNNIRIINRFSRVNGPIMLKAHYHKDAIELTSIKQEHNKVNITPFNE